MAATAVVSRARRRRAVLAGALALLAFVVAPTAGGAVTRQPRVPLGSLVPRAGVRSLALVPGLQEGDLRPGGWFSDGITASDAGNNEDVFDVYCYRDQTMTVSVTGNAGVGVALQLWDATSLDANIPLKVVESGPYPRKFTHKTTRDGWYYIAVYGMSGSGGYKLAYDISDPPVTHDVVRLSGPDRYRTAIALSQASFPATSNAVIVATGENFADALAGSGLCGSYDSPLLLTRPTTMPPAVLAEVDRLQPNDVFVLGDASAVATSVLTAMQGPGRTVTRLKGPNRFATAAAIAAQMKSHEEAEGRAPSTKAFVVNGRKYPDALSVSPFSFRQRMPILLVEQNVLPPATASAVASLGITLPFLIGSKDSVSDGVKAQLAGAQRIYGNHRLSTCLEVVTYGVDHGWSTWDTVGVTTGWNYPDALAGGVYAGKQDGVVLLTYWLYMPFTGATPPYNQPVYDTLATNATSVTRVRLFGSTASVAGCVTGDADAALGP